MWALAEDTRGTRQEASRKAEPTEMRVGALDSLVPAGPASVPWHSHPPGMQLQRPEQP